MKRGPHRVKYWLRVRTTCELYEQATTLHEQGVHLITRTVDGDPDARWRYLYDFDGSGS